MKIMTPGMLEEGVTPEEMEEVYQWSKKVAEKLEKLEKLEKDKE